MSEPTNVLPGEIVEVEVEHIDDNRFDIALNKAIMTHLVKRTTPQITLAYLSQAVGRFQASQIAGGMNPQAVQDVTSENMRLGFEYRREEIIKATEEQVARTKNGEKES